jgi:hypothetical protein
MRLSPNQQSIAAVPGAELQIPLTDNFVAKPFAQFGAVHAFGTDGRNANAYIYLGGLRSVAQWQLGAYTLSLGDGVVFAGDSTIGPGFGENYVSLQLAGEIRRLIGFSIDDFKPDLGVYLANYFYPAPLVFSRFLQSPLRIHNQDEIGFSIGSAEPFKLLWLSLPDHGPAEQDRVSQDQYPIRRYEPSRNAALAGRSCSPDRNDRRSDSYRNQAHA